MSTCEIKSRRGKGEASLACLVALLSLAIPAGAAPCGTSGEIISNDMRLLAGGGDTVWVATPSQNGGVNLTLDGGKTWQGFLLGCHEGALADIAFGSGTAAVLLNPKGHTEPVRLWHYSHGRNAEGITKIAWPDTVLADTAASFFGTDVAHVNGAFYVACQSGGMVRWDSDDNNLRGYLPGDTLAFTPSSFVPERHPVFNAPAAKVFAVDRYDSSRILAVTGPRLWLLDAASSWDSTITATLADAELRFERFETAFVNTMAQPSVLYAFIGYVRGDDSLTSLFRYGNGVWTLALRDAPRAIAPAADGFLYAIDGANRITAYRDAEGKLTPAITDEELNRRMVGATGLDRPDSLFDVLFLPLGGGLGNLTVASSRGLFLSPGEKPAVSKAPFLALSRPQHTLKEGLKETYALPGIITDDYQRSDRGKTTFIYKLSRDAEVTIRIYDYNLALVRTVIERAPRKAATATGRSTDRNSDVWDGTTASGRTVAPGVYYYKITTSTGERSFGKIVVAKGP